MYIIYRYIWNPGSLVDKDIIGYNEDIDIIEKILKILKKNERLIINNVKILRDEKIQLRKSTTKISNEYLEKNINDYLEKEDNRFIAGISTSPLIRKEIKSVYQFIEPYLKYFTVAYKLQYVYIKLDKLTDNMLIV